MPYTYDKNLIKLGNKYPVLDKKVERLYPVYQIIPISKTSNTSEKGKLFSRRQQIVVEKLPV